MWDTRVLGAVALSAVAVGCVPVVAPPPVVIVAPPSEGTPKVLAVAEPPDPGEHERARPHRTRWVSDERGGVPDGAEPMGVEQPPGSEPLWACRAMYAGPGKGPGVHVGKVGRHLGGCRIGYGGTEVNVESYDVLVGRVRWLPTQGDQIPRGALAAGHEGPEDGGAPLLLCRAQYPAGTSGVHIGKTRSGFGGCNIGWGGREITVREYEVAVGR